MRSPQSHVATRNVAVGSIVALLGLGAGGRSHGAESGPRDAAEVLHSEIARGRTPSVQYRFFSPDSILFSHAEGLADVWEARPTTPGTTYNAFSVTKTFTALAIMRLADQNLVRLDSPAAEFLPGFPYGSDITVRQLLTHSAGFTDPIPLRWTHLREEHATFDRDRFFDAIFSRRPTTEYGPNERFAYSNLGYVLLGRIIETVTGMSYEQYLTDQVLHPLGLTAGEVGFAIDDSVHARGYHRRRSFTYVALRVLIDREKYMEPGRGRWRAFRPYYVNGAPYGGLVGTADGFARYAQALISPGDGIVSEESRRALLAENSLSDGRPSGMALAWFRGELDGHTYYAHAGGGGGYYAEVRIYPTLQRGSVILFNRTGMSDRRFLDRVDRYLIGEATR